MQELDNLFDWDYENILHVLIQSKQRINALITTISFHPNIEPEVDNHIQSELAAIAQYLESAKSLSGECQHISRNLHDILERG